MSQNGYHDDPYAKEFGINISDRLASVEARVLPAPWVIHYSSRLRWDRFRLIFICWLTFLTRKRLQIMQLKYNDAGKEKECLPQVGQWNMMNKVGPLGICGLRPTLPWW